MRLNLEFIVYCFLALRGVNAACEVNAIAVSLKPFPLKVDW